MEYDFASARLEPWEVGDTCVICGSPFTHRHHIFFGSHKSFSDRYNYLIPLCWRHHNGSDIAIHFNSRLDLEWKRKAQRHFEQYYGTRDDFIRECGKSYLED